MPTTWWAGGAIVLGLVLVVGASREWWVWVWLIPAVVWIFLGILIWWADD